MNKKMGMWIAGVIIIAGGAFYAGATYDSQFMKRVNDNGMGGRMRSSTGRARLPGGQRFTAGEIISKDDSSITIKMSDGSTKIVLVGSSTQVMKSAVSSLDELTTSMNVVVTGSVNSDGSVAAESVQVRQVGSVPFTERSRTNQ